LRGKTPFSAQNANAKHKNGTFRALKYRYGISSQRPSHYPYKRLRYATQSEVAFDRFLNCSQYSGEFGYQFNFNDMTI